MRKSEELAVLDEAILKLGSESYLGPWLAGVRAEVEAMIRSDYFPDNNLAATTKECKGVVENAQKIAAECIEQAQRTARNVRSESDRLTNAAIDEAIKKLAWAKIR